jgi:hypothetical protein
MPFGAAFAGNEAKLSNDRAKIKTDNGVSPMCGACNSSDLEDEQK